MNRSLFFRIIRFVFVFCFITYITLYVFNSAGYNEYKSGRKVRLTEEKIKEFEKDISKGKSVDVKDYVIYEQDYSNKLSRTGYKISYRTEKVISAGVSKAFKFLSKIAE